MRRGAVNQHVSSQPVATSHASVRPNGARNPAPARNVKCLGEEPIQARDQAKDRALSRNIREIEREIAHAARWAVKWRMLQKEAIEVADGMREPEARHQMLFISDCYQLLAERAEQIRERLVVYAAAVKRGPC